MSSLRQEPLCSVLPQLARVLEAGFNEARVGRSQSHDYLGCFAGACDEIVAYLDAEVRRLSNGRRSVRSADYPAGAPPSKEALLRLTVSDDGRLGVAAAQQEPQESLYLVTASVGLTPTVHVRRLS